MPIMGLDCFIKPAELGNQWDLSRPRGRGQRPPLTPEYQAIYEARLADRAIGGLGGNFTAQCLPHGMQQMMSGIYPMQIGVTPRTTYILSEYNEPRRIFMTQLARNDRRDIQWLFHRKIDR